MKRESENKYKDVTADVTMEESWYIGKGTFGKVYRGYMHSRDEIIAVKHI